MNRSRREVVVWTFQGEGDSSGGGRRRIPESLTLWGEEKSRKHDEGKNANWSQSYQKKKEISLTLKGGEGAAAPNR